MGEVGKSLYLAKIQKSIVCYQLLLSGCFSHLGCSDVITHKVKKAHSLLFRLFIFLLLTFPTVIIALDAFTEHYGSGYTLEDAKERFQGEWDSEEEFAEHLVDDCYGDMPEFARRYFDMEQFARDLFNFDYTFIDGYVFSD